jgi:hypothetical protein
MTKLTTSHRVALLCAVVAATATIFAAVIGGVLKAPVSNSTSGDHSPIVNGNSGPVTIR